MVNVKKKKQDDNYMAIIYKIGIGKKKLSIKRGNSLAVQWLGLQGHEFDPWLGNQDPARFTVQPKKNKKGTCSIMNSFL